MGADEATRRARKRAWFGLVGLIAPIAILLFFIWPWVKEKDDRADWVAVNGVAGKEIDLDHRQVTFTLPGRPPRTTAVPVMRTVEAGDTIRLYYPPGRPDLIEQDRSDFVLPYYVFGGAALVMTCLILGRFAAAMRGPGPVRRTKRFGFDGYQRHRAPPVRNVSHVFGDHCWELIGGVRIGTWNATAPLVRLTVDHEWCRITNRWRFVPGPTVWMARSEVWQVRIVSGLFGKGVMFDAHDDAFAGVIFWTFDPTGVLWSFAAAGWPVQPPSGPVLPSGRGS